MFETTHGSFSCDVCMKQQPAKATMHGCRNCNYDVCQACHVVEEAPIQAPVVTAVPRIVAVVAASAPQAKFVSDVTLADGCVVRPGEQLNKTWRVRNSGGDAWPAGTRIGHVGGDAFGGPLHGVEVQLASPGEAVNVTVPLTMPTQPGRYTSYWRMMTPHPQSSKFGHRFWVTVNVVAPTTTNQGASRDIFPSAGVVIRSRTSQPPSVSFPPPARPTFGYLPGSPALPRAIPPSARPPPPPPMRPTVVETPVSKEFEVAVSQITEFGFTDIDKIVRILKEVNGDAGAAIDKLLENA